MRVRPFEFFPLVLLLLVAAGVGGTELLINDLDSPSSGLIRVRQRSLERVRDRIGAVTAR